MKHFGQFKHKICGVMVLVQILHVRRPSVYVWGMGENTYYSTTALC